MNEWNPKSLHGALKVKADRLESMRLGMEQLRQWLQDLMRQGLATAGSRPPSFWMDMAAQMVDAGLGGIARQLRAIPELIQTHSDWPDEVLRRLADLYLLYRSFQQLEQLPTALQAELLSRCGVNASQKKLREQKGILDRWMLLGQVIGNDENLRFRRSWVLGLDSRSWGLILDFAHGSRDFEQEWPVGSLIEGEAVYFPGAFPQRLLFREGFRPSPPLPDLQGLPASPDLLAFREQWQQALSQSPWIKRYPVLLEKVIPVFQKNSFFLLDREERLLKLGGDPSVLWALTALAGGRSLTLCGEFSGRALRPLSAIRNNRLIIL